MKLFIWKEVLADSTDGVIFALADNVEQARQLALDSVDDDCDRKVIARALAGEPEIYEEPYGFVLWGGA